MKRYKKIGIICAMDIEAELLINAMNCRSVEEISGRQYTSGVIGDTDVVVAVCGIGKVLAGACTQTMILRYAPECIINSGIAGGLSDRLVIGDVAIATSLVQHDFDVTSLGDPVGFLPSLKRVYVPTTPEVADILGECLAELGVNHVLGVIASGDQFIDSQIKKDRILSNFEDLAACEMESAAIGTICYINNIDYGIIRSISDGGDDDAIIDFPKFEKEASDIAAKVALSFIEKTSC